MPASPLRRPQATFKDDRYKTVRRTPKERAISPHRRPK
jgi:hypothetical protein